MGADAGPIGADAHLPDHGAVGRLDLLARTDTGEHARIRLRFEQQIPDGLAGDRELGDHIDDIGNQLVHFSSAGSKNFGSAGSSFVTSVTDKFK
ncbi:hypothetical protein [Nocardia sp. CY41]|uniref:hypothetical protein n=1 Tax=Nocardia sp. CY41 TaxID=2608686 RepID=UPI001F33F45F|nr:hypothetical protein [Nocardia sp. CY41]